MGIGGALQHCKALESIANRQGSPMMRQTTASWAWSVSPAHIATRYLIAAINRIRNGRQDVAIARQALVVSPVSRAFAVHRCFFWGK
ncbi:hypothetical protein OM948_08350 [Xanthomonas citri pv. fuscans]|uniref:hypothetical protein n=1 Tax=Xanthomonas citri TaxID=346 RepID=UPI002226FCC7|nr:hypothetical protein [Xanthomonas citri]UZB05453.1 hypothetical protein OM948_08350 [Xanthomonas citri pv. fuscans]